MRKTYLTIPIIIFLYSNAVAQYITVSGPINSCGNASGQLQFTESSTAIIVKWEEGTYSPGPDRVFTATKTYPGSPTLSYNVNAPGKKAFRAIYKFDQYYPEEATLPVEITAFAYPVGGTLATDATSFLNGGTVALQLTGASGTIQYKKVGNSGGGWQDITLTNGTYHITETTKFMASVNRGPCYSSQSNTVEVKVYKAGIISGPPSVVENEKITLYDNGYKVKHWEYSIDGGTSWIQKTEMFPYRMLGDTWFRVLYDLGPYGEEYSNILKITATPYTKAHPNLINGDNHIREQQITVPGITNPNAVASLSENQKREVITFLDGRGRTIQKNIHKGSPDKGDIIAFNEYDDLGRQSIQYLPYTSYPGSGTYKNGASTEQAAFYISGTSNKIAKSPHPFSKTVYEQSPLGRILEQGAVGTQWQPGTGHTKKVNYSNNATNEVRLFREDGTSVAYYEANVLSKIEATDEDQNKTQTFTDKSGHVVLSKIQLDETIDDTFVPWLETYYIYNALGQVKYIISPKGVDALKTGGWSFTQNIKDQYTHQFVYDARGRLVEKKVPGQAWMYYCYDRLDRLVLAQDGLSRSENKWLFIKYDRRGRPVMQGLYTHNATREYMQENVVDPLYAVATDKYYEDRGTVNHGYTNQSFPTTNIEVLAVNYYDNYDFDYNGADDFAYTPQGLTDENSPISNTRGLQTGAKRKILGTDDWLYQYVFYDAKGNMIQERSNNHLSMAVDNLTTAVYDFEGKLKIKKTYHNAGAGRSTTVLNKYGYDHSGRLLRVYQNNNGSGDQLRVQYEYNELGQLVDKKLHKTTENNFLQSIDYRYHIRGWLSSINNAQLTNDGANNNDTNDYFGMEFLYQNTETGLVSTSEAKYNGSISAVKWKGVGTASGPENQSSYKYNYDKAGRLTSGIYQKSAGSAWANEAGAFDEQTAYDLNGNITGLQRNARTNELSEQDGLPVISAATEAVDNLTYTYAPSTGDRLVKVVDATGSKTGFDNGDSGTANDYTYDDNGNLKSDLNKGISDITYNLLGKATSINFSDGRKIEYVYDAVGTKLSVKVYNAGNNTSLLATDYVDDFVYENSTLSFFSSPEGRVANNGGVLEHQYFIADHMGNTRVVFGSKTPAPALVTATFEGDSDDDSGLFQNINPNNVVPSVAANHTDQGSMAVRMNQHYRVGPSKSLSVAPGDKVDLEVYAYHESSSGYGTADVPLATMAALVAGGFGATAGPEGGAVYEGISDALAAFGPGGNRGDDRPAAYLNYILFDRAYNLLDMGWKPVPGNAFTKERVFFNTLEIAEAGYLFVYLSYENESDNWVYFDDFKITHTKTNIVQYNDYYPYGLQTNASWTREGSGNNHLYNHGNELNPATGWYETFFRNYDPTTGRFTGVDPLASKFPSLSGYHYAYNSPVMFNDPLGAQGEPGNPWFGGGYRWMDYSGPPPSAYNSMGASTFGSAVDNYWSQAMTGNNWAERTMYRNELANQARGGDMGAVREYAARYGGGLKTVEVWHSTAQAGGETYYHYEIVVNGGEIAQSGGSLQAGLSLGDGLTSIELAIAALKPSFIAAASQAKHGGSVPFHLKKNIFKSPHAVNNNAVRLGKVSGSFARNGAAIMKVAAPALTMTAIVTNGISIFSDGQLTWGDAFVGGNTALQIAFPVYGVIYGVVDVGTSYVTGTSLTDYTKNYIDSNTSGSINLGF